MRRRVCFFALDIYGWKSLGEVGQLPARECVGAYFLPDGNAPAGAALHIETSEPAPNQDPWGPVRNVAAHLAPNKLDYHVLNVQLTAGALSSRAWKRSTLSIRRDERG
jgi:hypothetical protein